MATFFAKPLFAADCDIYTSKAFIEACLILQRTSRTFHTLLMADLKVIGINKMGVLPFNTAATDGYYIYICVPYFLSLPAEARASVLYHEIYHAAVKHGWRAKGYKARGKGPDGLPFSRKAYNHAGDYIINADIKSLGLPVPHGWLIRDDIDNDDLTDAVYGMVNAELLAEQAQLPPPPPPPTDEEIEQEAADAQAAEDAGDSGDAGDDGDEAEAGDAGEGDDSSQPADGNDPLTGEPADDGEGDGHGCHDLEPAYDGNADEQAQQAKADADKMEAAVGDAIDRTTKSWKEGDIDTEQKAGAEVGNSTREAGRARKQDWRTELQDLMQRAGHSGEANWKRIHRGRFNTLGIVSPTRKGDVNLMVFTIDISASVLDDALDMFLIEAAAAIDILKPANVIILWTNHRVHSVDEVTTGQELLNLCRPETGGTRMGAAVEWLETNGYTPEVHLIFTDLQMSHSDIAQCAASGAVFVADHDVSKNQWTQRNLRNSGCRVISVAD
jgi:predicted metal-dependent peptidase